MGQKVARMAIFGWGRTEESCGDPGLEFGANRLHVREVSWVGCWEAGRNVRLDVSINSIVSGWGSGRL